MKCECGTDMNVVNVRDDGCCYFFCPKCGNEWGEETEEWFENMGVSIDEM